MSETAEFRCIRCGECCRSLISEDRGMLRGFTLLPEEAHLFPANVVRPAVGVGRRPHDHKFKVLAYQLAVEPCPHLEETGCVIYGDRPSSCRQFPFSLEPSKDGEPLLGVDLNCPSAARLLDAYTQISFEGREAAEKLLRIKERVAQNPRRVWLYDLRTDRWVRGDRLG
jgi:Fe-S-cluster containining protein